MKRVSDAIRTIEQSADRTVVNQVWYFFDSPNDLPFLRRLRGLTPPSDPLNDPYITFRMRDTFAPVPQCYVASLESSLNATLPTDYKIILKKFGPIHIPGEKNTLALIDPMTICHRLLTYDYRPWETPLIPIAHYTGDPNAIALKRNAGTFLPEIYRLNHELSNGNDLQSPIFDSLADLILHQLSVTS